MLIVWFFTCQVVYTTAGRVGEVKEEKKEAEVEDEDFDIDAI